MENIPHAVKFFLTPNFSLFELELQSSAKALKTTEGTWVKGLNICGVSKHSPVR